MHPQTTINQFIDLRSQGFSLSRIADQLGVSKRTLIDWNREHQADITALRALELEAFHEKILASHEQELSRLAACQSKIDEELAKRFLETLSTDKLFRLSLLVRREIRNLCTAAERTIGHRVPASLLSPAVSQSSESPFSQSQIKTQK